MKTEDNIISKEEILRIVKQRESEATISFEEAYKEVLNYKPKI